MSTGATAAARGTNGTAPPALEQLLQGLDEIHGSLREDIGPDDARAVRRLIRLSGFRAVRGRRRIREAKDLATWLAGIRDLFGHHILEVTNGHSVAHGAFDDLPGPEHSRRHRWNNAVVGEDWRIEHNEAHHPNTNLVVKDTDFALLFFRFSGLQRWRPWHLVQLPALAALPFTSGWFIPLVATVGRARHEGRPVLSRQTLEPWLRSVGAAMAKEYVAPWRAANPVQAVLGHAIARMGASALTGAALFAGHHGEEAFDLLDDPDGDRAEAYLRQIMCTLNLRIPDRQWEEIHIRGVNYHIEHHLFPDLPIERLTEIAPRVEALCRSLGVPYETTTIPEAVRQLFVLAARYSWPTSAPSRTQAERRALYRALIESYRAHRARTPRSTSDAVHALRLARRRVTLRARADEPLLMAIERAGIAHPTGCRRGACQTCRVRKISGATSMDPRGGRTHVTVCTARPREDVELDL